MKANKIKWEFSDKPPEWAVKYEWVYAKTPWWKRLLIFLRSLTKRIYPVQEDWMK